MTTEMQKTKPAGRPLHGGGDISVGLIEDNRVLLQGLTALLGQVPHLTVVHAGSGADMSPVERLKPDVLLLDVGLENGDSLSIARRLRDQLPECRVVMMDLLPTEDDIRDFVQAGVSGFVLKDASFDELVSTIRAVALGSTVLPSAMAGSLFSQIAFAAVALGGTETADAAGLTTREREVIDLISSGLSNKRIASGLDISVHTVKSHVRNIMEKLALHTRLQIAAWAHHGGDEPEEK
jgi:two-component system, NarL family, nitrate/nitrite response regulator NarL